MHRCRKPAYMYSEQHKYTRNYYRRVIFSDIRCILRRLYRKRNSIKVPGEASN